MATIVEARREATRATSAWAWHYLTSGSLAVVAAAAGALTFFAPGVLGGTAVMNGSARGTALIVFAVAVPVLLGSMLLASHGQPRALITWLGTATYLLYNAVLFLIATPFNNLFLLYVAMFALATWTLVLLLHVLRPQEFVKSFVFKLPARGLGGLLVAVAVLNALLWLKGVLPALGGPMPPSFLDGTGLTTMPTHVQDLSFWLPLTFVVGIWTWQRRPWGVVLAGALIVYGLLESIGVATDQAFGHAADPASNVVSVEAVPVFAVLAIVEMVALYFYLRVVPGSNGAQPVADATHVS